MTHPTGLFPFAIRAALTLESMPASTGHEADVPAIPTVPPSIESLSGPWTR